MADPTSDAPLTRDVVRLIVESKWNASRGIRGVWDVRSLFPERLAELRQLHETELVYARDYDELAARLAALQRERDKAKELFEAQCARSVALQATVARLEAEQAETQSGLEMWHAKFMAMTEQMLAESEKSNRLEAEQGVLRTERDEALLRLTQDIGNGFWARKYLTTKADVDSLLAQVADLRTCPVCGCRWAHPGQTDCPLCAAQAGMVGVSDLQQQVTDLSRQLEEARRG